MLIKMFQFKGAIENVLSDDIAYIFNNNIHYL